MNPNAPQDRPSSWRSHKTRFESCEPRLVLSAQVLFDVLGDHVLHSQNPLESPIYGPIQHPTTPITPTLAEAHSQTGWLTAQQEFGLRGTGQTIAVIDTGIAWDHVALGKGYGAGYRVVGGWDFAENDAKPYDDGPTGFHGTHVAGIVGSSHAKHTGVAPDVDLVALRVFNDAGKGQIDWVERALQWVHTNRNAFENPITTVNLSIGTSWNSDSDPNWGTLENELRQLYEDGIVVTASAGNSFKSFNAPGLSYPATSQFVLPIASVDDNGQLSDFSQRHQRVLAAPGRNIISTVPDHVLGRDGKVDDFSTATGTSMASPYVAGASVLVREAMQMVGAAQINAQSIIDHLHNTADTIYDAITKASYHRLNLQNAIDSLIPEDSVGDTSNQFQRISLNQAMHKNWMNHVGDVDVFRFTTDAGGQLQLDANSKWVDSLQWNLSSDGNSLGNGDLALKSLHLESNRTYELRLSANKEIGPYELNWSFTADPSPVIPTPTPAPSPSPSPTPAPLPLPLNLGSVDYAELHASAGKSYQFLAAHNGILTVQWSNPDHETGTLLVRGTGGHTASDRTWEDHVLRLDLQVTAGQRFEVQLPSSVAGDQGQLVIANVVGASGKTLNVYGTAGNDELKFDMSRHGEITFGDVRYAFTSGQYSQVQFDGSGGIDSITIVGSAESDKVDLKPSQSTVSNSRLAASLVKFEDVTFVGGGGADRVYLYDSQSDDTLTARPRFAELKGAGFRLAVEGVERIYVHATAGGQDLANLYDSTGNDRLSARPQFASMSGTGFFNYARGFERIAAYASGGIDHAELFDSTGNDQFSTNKNSATISGPGYSASAHNFEQVTAFAQAGGNDLATLYGSGSQTQWHRSGDTVGFKESSWSREVRGFESVQTIHGNPPDLAGAQHRLSRELAPATQFESSNTVNLSSAPPVPTSSMSLTTLAVAQREQFDEPTDPPGIAISPEKKLFAEVLDMKAWMREKFIPQRDLIEDPKHEAEVLHQVFEQFGRN